MQQITSSSLLLFAIGVSMVLGAVCGLYRGASNRSASTKLLLACISLPVLLTVVAVAIGVVENKGRFPIDLLHLGMILFVPGAFIAMLLFGLVFAIMSRQVFLFLYRQFRRVP